MRWESFANWVQSIPMPLQWALAIVGAAIGLGFILRPDSVIRTMRKWLVAQLRWLRRPSYRRALKLYGWLLFVTGALLMSLLAVTCWR
jgi:hypothetical protein